jgi:hypothetical protein
MGVDVPPEIAAVGYRRIERWSSARLAAANRPEMAAIGTPAPGCVLPPARYSPGTRLRDPGRLNDARQPWEARP